MRFSQRLGHTPVKDVVQLEAIDQGLRVAVWNVLDTAVWGSVPAIIYTRDTLVHPLVARLWAHYFKQPLDSIPAAWSEARTRIRDHVFGALWYDVYDLLEFIVNDASQDGEYLAELLNEALVAELSGYRFVGGHVTPITAPEELGAIEEALTATDGIRGVGTHLATALDLLADRQLPDYGTRSRSRSARSRRWRIEPQERRAKRSALR